MDFNELKRLLNLCAYEDNLYSYGYNLIAGADEVGRGCLAGPIVAAAVILRRNSLHIEGINDSKKLSAKKRQKIFRKIVKSCVCWSIAKIPPQTIDNISLGKANKMVIKNALNGLKIKPDIAITDALEVKTDKLGYISIPIINGDELSVSIAAASILAKVIRDALMKKYSRKFPYYGLENNKGYGTKKHLHSIKKYGICEIHRKSFKNVC